MNLLKFLNIGSKRSDKDTQTSSALSTTLDNPREWRNFFGINEFVTEHEYRSIAYACINARAENVSKATLYLQQKKLKGFKDIESHIFYDLLEGVHLFGDKEVLIDEIFYWISVYLDLGKGRAFVYYEKDPIKRPSRFVLLNPEKVTIVYDSTQTRISKYLYTDGGRSIEYNFDEVIYFKLFNPKNPFDSKSTSSACKYSLNIDEYQSVYQSSFYKNGAAPEGVVVSKNNLPENQYNRLREQWNERRAGMANAGKTAILEGDTDYKLIKNSQKEMDYVNSRTENAKEIMSIFKVPPPILGIIDAKYANAEVALRSFMEVCIIPFSKHIFNPFKIFVKHNYDKRIYLKADYSLWEDPKIQIERTKMLIETGTIKRNEVRSEADYEEIMDDNRANELMIPSTLVGNQENNQNSNNGNNNQQSSGI